jgi:hypothetical protein
MRIETHAPCLLPVAAICLWASAQQPRTDDTPSTTRALSGGRLVRVASDADHRHNNGRPVVHHSDDGGRTWEPLIAPLAIDPCGIVEAADPQGAPLAPPGLAVDRSFLPNHVYIAFHARSAPGATNTDIFIARSIDGGTTWPSDQIVQITDAMLGLTDPVDTDPITGARQHAPAIAVDSCGGINLMFYDNRFDTDRSDKYSTMDVYFARVTNFDPPAAPTVHTARMTTETFPADKCTAPAMSAFLGDYQTMSVSADGTWIWAAYIARECDPTLGWTEKNCYVHRVQIHCLEEADFNGDGAVTEADAAEFLIAYGAEDPAADVDLDWRVTDADLDLFFDRYDRARRGE